MFGPLISNFRFSISDFRFQIFDFRFQIFDFGFRISDFRFPISHFTRAYDGTSATKLGIKNRQLSNPGIKNRQLSNPGRRCECQILDFGICFEFETGPEIESILDFGGKYLDFGFRFEIDLRALKFSILDFGTTKRGNRGRDVYISQVFDFECIKVFDFEFVPEMSYTPRSTDDA